MYLYDQELYMVYQSTANMHGCTNTTDIHVYINPIFKPIHVTWYSFIYSFTISVHSVDKCDIHFLPRQYLTYNQNHHQSLQSILIYTET